MKSYMRKSGFTLIELIVVIAIIMALAVMVVTAGRGILDAGKKKLTESTLAILVSALQEYKEYGYQYRNIDPAKNYSKLVYPLDCTNFDQANLRTALSTVMNGIVVAINAGAYENEYSSSEAMYYFLNKVSTSRKVLEKIEPSLVTDKDKAGNAMTITVDGRMSPLLRVVDAWGKSLEYDYYELENYYNGNIAQLKDMIDSRRNFPLIRSAGPDGQFYTTDDITSR